ncbi:myrosinase 1-like isoform X2 [Folsomia candida]|uniref:myrosinase 1-like isoform X2 n=1 Tax=Folsomia candida TaxID=158441 RepID=UPI0016050C15|nr:myrosinase 1-like isoform X2 [Folsomia candida]
MSIFYKFTNLIAFATLVSNSTCQEDTFLYDTFPPGFQWGFSSSSYQIEGAWKEDGKGVNIWDTFVHRIPSPIPDKSNADIGCDSYHKYDHDVSLLKYIGAGVYRFSLSWTRILPTGRIDQINPAGIRYYNNLINLLLANGIEPMITLHHWDLPQPLQDLGGWPNENVIQHYSNFANLAFHTFGDRVKKWITFSEPNVMCLNGYITRTYAPGHKNVNEAINCARNVIISHARVYRIYDRVFRPLQGGKVGMSLSSYWLQPKDPQNPEHRKSAEFWMHIEWGLFAFPIVFGSYNDETKQLLGKLRKFKLTSAPVEFTAEESVEIKGSYDFWGLNHYSTYLVEPTKVTTSILHGDFIGLFLGAKISFDPTWPKSAIPHTPSVPWGFRKMLNWINQGYGSPEIYIMENGYPDSPNTGLEDVARVKFHRDYINEMLKAVKIDGVQVTMYTAWGLLDCFEWSYGYTVNFGVVYVNHSHPERPRTPKLSATCLQQIFSDNGFPHENFSPLKIN